MADVAPITPAQYLALIPNPDAGVCDEMQKVLFQLPQADYTMQAWMFNEDATITTEFATAICNALSLIDCAGGITTTTTASTGPTTTTTTTAPATANAYAVASEQGTIDPCQLIQINLATGAITAIGTPAELFFGLAQDPVGGGTPLYGLVVNGSAIDLVTISKTTGVVSVVQAGVAAGINPTCIRFNSAGQMYLADDIGRLYTMNKTTGSTALLGTTPGSKYLTDMAFLSGTLYGVGYDASDPGNPQLFTVNITNGALTNINPVTGMAGSGTGNRLTVANAILYGVSSNASGQVNTTTAVFTIVATYDIGTYGILRGLANGM